MPYRINGIDAMAELTAALKRIFGFDHFRAGQEAVVRDALAGRDVLALMPTGGGNSLCFQLPALLRPDVTTLREMVERRPLTLSQFAELPGVGQAKLARYGNHFIAAIARHSQL
jgi:superfamily II DNA helicase RecQ